MLSVMTIGLNDNDKGHIGDMIVQGTSLWTIGPPADRLYAVEPVGVDIINPYFIFNKLLL